MFNLHKHNFVKDGNNLYCFCGKIKRLECDHEWIIHNIDQIIVWNNWQERQILVCKKCGKFKNINTTTGEITN